MHTMYFIWLTIRCFQSRHFQNLSVFSPLNSLDQKIEKPPYLVQSHLVINKFKKQMFYHSCSSQLSSTNIIIAASEETSLAQKRHKHSSCWNLRGLGDYLSQWAHLVLGHGGQREGVTFPWMQRYENPEFLTPIILLFPSQNTVESH